MFQPTTPARIRSATGWEPEGPTLRLHIGLEDPKDLIFDLDRGLDALRKPPAKTTIAVFSRLGAAGFTGRRRCPQGPT